MRNPYNRRLRLSAAAALGIALLAGWGSFTTQWNAWSVQAVDESTRERLGGLQVRAERTVRLEQEWVSSGFKTEYLIAPVGPMPCVAATAMLAPEQRHAAIEAFIALRDVSQGFRLERLTAIADSNPGNLLVALILATELAHAGQWAAAERVAAEALERSSVDEELLVQARSGIDVSSLDLFIVLHLQHALALARLHVNAQPAWMSLKNAIGLVGVVGRRRFVEGKSGDDSWNRMLITPPGCASADPGALSVSDLFNNLIVAYMTGGFHGSPRERALQWGDTGQFSRALRQLVTAQLARQQANGWKEESQLWALANVEQAFTWGVTDDARLNANAIEVIDWWIEAKRCPVSICTSELVGQLEILRDSMLERAFRRRNITQHQETEYARALTRLLARSTDRAHIARNAYWIESLLPPNEAEVLRALIAADAARGQHASWIIGKKTAEPPWTEKLGRYAKRWNAAARGDFVAAAAQAVKEWEPADQRKILPALRQLVDGGDVPPELVALEANQSNADRLLLRLRASRWWWAFTGLCVGVVLWLAAVWILVQIWEWRMLETSLYKVERKQLSEKQQPKGV